MGAPDLIVPGTASGTGPVGGTGTTNTIPRWTGPSTLGDSGITDNGSTVSFVGRNITAPSTAGGASYVLAPTSGQVFGQTVGSSVWYLGRTTAAGAAVQPDICVNASGNVGIGTASPGNSKLNVTDASAFAFQAVNIVASGTNQDAGLRLQGSGGKAFRIQQPNTSAGIFFYDETNSAERARIDLAGRWLVGTSTAASGPAITAVISSPTAGGQQWHIAAGSPGGVALVPTPSTATWYVYSNALGSESYQQSCKMTATGIDLSGASATPGLKLPATPGNADVQTLDAYLEGTWNPSDQSGAGLTFTYNNTSVYTRVGRLIHSRIDLTFPVTASGANAAIGLAFTSITYGATGAAYVTGIGSVTALINAGSIELYNAAGARLTNANLSGARVTCSFVYQAS